MEARRAPAPARRVVSSVFDAEVRACTSKPAARPSSSASKVLFGVVEAPGLNIVERRGELDGNWVTNFTWLHTGSPLFAGLGLTRVTGFEAAAATPRTLIDGVGAGRRGGRATCCQACSTDGSTRITRRRCSTRSGKGKVVFTTFDTAAYGKDLFVTHLVHRLVEYVKSDKCAPASELARR